MSAPPCICGHAKDDHEHEGASFCTDPTCPCLGYISAEIMDETAEGEEDQGEDDFDRGA